MKFVPTAELTYWWPIKVKLPHPEKSGLWVTETFEMQFVAVDQDKAQAIADEIREIKEERELREREHDQLLNACRDWRGVVDADKQPVPFSRELLLTMLKAGPWFYHGIYESYARSLSAGEVRKGN